MDDAYNANSLVPLESGNIVYCSKSSKAGNGSNGAGNSTDIGGKIDYGKDVNKKKIKQSLKLRDFLNQIQQWIVGFSERDLV